MRRRRKKSSRQTPQRLSGRISSLAFFLAIPVMFGVGSLFLIILALDIEQNGIHRERWLVFISGFILGTALLSLCQISWLAVLIHEIKHGVVVLLSGNLLSNIEVGKHTGRIEYQVYKHRDQYEPYVILAPYFFPLLSFPLLIGSMWLGDKNTLPLLSLLGGALALDTVSGWTELYPNQSDLHRVLGGFLFAGLFIGGAHYLWILTCCLWVQTEWEGFLQSVYFAVRGASTIIAR